MGGLHNAHARAEAALSMQEETMTHDPKEKEKMPQEKGAQIPGRFFCYSLDLALSGELGKLYGQSFEGGGAGEKKVGFFLLLYTQRLDG